MNTLPILSWPQRTIVELEPGDRQALIGRAAAFIINGVECMVLCQNLDDLGLVADKLNGGLVQGQWGKATMITTERLAVADLPEPEPVAQPDPIVESANLVVESPPIDLIPTVDGQPIVEYAAPPAETAPTPVAVPPKRRGRPPKVAPTPVAKPFDFDAEDDEL